MKKVIIVGAGGHAKVIADIIRLSGDKVYGYLDDKPPEELVEYQIIGTTSDIGKWDCFYFVAVGDCKIREKLMKYNVKWYTAIHPSAVIASDSTIREGSCVMANAVVNPGVTIGRGVIINTAATVDHDCTISDFVHISPGTHLAGNVLIGERTWIGIGVSIKNDIHICNDCILGAGTVVVKTIGLSGTYIGVPAMRMGDRK